MPKYAFSLNTSAPCGYVYAAVGKCNLPAWGDVCAKNSNVAVAVWASCPSSI